MLIAGYAPKTPEVTNKAAHWDYLLREMQWLSDDMTQVFPRIVATLMNMGNCPQYVTNIFTRPVSM